ncbi:MAG: MnhB domain-containing protein [Solirubrobacterales bacterium]|nr:MnhB domain-containing protein [Solirubrobacterales bacterium]MBA3861853.1 MnhB domain-containing protein [Solirubrobacterales bacterium]
MSSLVTRVVARMLLAPLLVVAAAILVKGFTDVGDGFSAGVVAALGILLQYVTLGREEVERTLPVRFLPHAAFVALLGALAVALVPLLRGDPILTHLPPPGAEVATVGKLELMTAVAFDACVFLVVLGAVVGIVHAVARAYEEMEPA